MHYGQDFAAPSGEPIRAEGAGVVRAVGTSSSAGNWIEIVLDQRPDIILDHFHMRAPSHLAAGDRVDPGDTIGYVGSTGDSTGPHLHLEARVIAGGQRIDPIPVLDALVDAEPSPTITIQEDPMYRIALGEDAGPELAGRCYLVTSLGHRHLSPPASAALDALGAPAPVDLPFGEFWALISSIDDLNRSGSAISADDDLARLAAARGLAA